MHGTLLYGTTLSTARNFHNDLYFRPPNIYFRTATEHTRATPSPFDLTPVALRACQVPTQAPNQSSGSLLLARPQSGAQKLKTCLPRAVFPIHPQIVSEDRFGQNIYRQFGPTLIRLLDFRLPIRPRTGEKISVSDYKAEGAAR
jgi:hypothetical protein